MIKQGPQRGHLYAVLSNGSDHHEWDYPADVDNVIHPDWSPDGTELAFVTDRPDGSTDLLVSPADGGTARVLVDSAAGTVSDSPAWSPDGRYIAYDTDTAGDPRFRIVVADAVTGAAVTTYDAPEAIDVLAPRWRRTGSSWWWRPGGWASRAGWTNGSPAGWPPSIRSPTSRR